MKGLVFGRKKKNRTGAGTSDRFEKNNSEIVNGGDYEKNGENVNKKREATGNMTDFDRVKAEVDIVAEIERRTGNRFKKVGKSLRMNPCPVCGHNDHFDVDPEKRTWICRSQDKGGSIIDFVMITSASGCSELEAMIELAEFYNIPISRNNPDDRTERKEPEPEHVRIFEAAAEHYHRNLLKNKPAIAYQTGKRKHDLNTLKHFRVGFADGKLTEALAKQGFSPEQCAKYGLSKPDGKNGWRDYFPAWVYVYPHLTGAGKVGRFTIKDPNGKFRHQTEKEFWLEDCLFYNMQAFKGSELTLVEGENDLLSVFGSGIKEIAAIDGQLSKEQTEYLLKWVRKGSKVKTVRMCFDNDDAGKNYSEKLSEALKFHCVTDQYVQINSRLYDIEKQRVDRQNEKAAEKTKTEQSPDESGIAKKEPGIIKARQMRLFRISFDDKCKDIDLWLQGQTNREQAMQGLMKSAKPVLKSLKDVISEHKFWTFTLYGAKKNPDAGETGELIFDWFSQADRFYMDMNRNVCSLYYRSTVYDISNTNVPFTSLLYEESGLITSAKNSSEIVSVLKAKTWSSGEHVMGMFWLHTDHTAQTIWFNLCNERNEIIRLSPGSTEVMKNGINPDNVMLITSPVMKGITFLPETDIQEAMNLFHDRVVRNLCCSPANQYYLACLLCNTLFTQFTEARGITKHSGNGSNGKSSVMKFRWWVKSVDSESGIPP
ncbi:MAG: toprim domain-containing protein [Desulfococcaceae bacterium]